MLPPRLLAGLTGLATLVPLLLTTAAGPAAADPEVRRLAGADRFSTAVAVSRSSHPGGAATVVLTTGLDFPDALAGAPYAGMKRRPLLLTEPHCMPPATLAEVQRLEATQLIPFGGDTVVSLSARTRVPC